MTDERYTTICTVRGWRWLERFTTTEIPKRDRFQRYIVKQAEVFQLVQEPI